MKLDKHRTQYRDDNTVDFSRKRRVKRDSGLVSSKYLDFSPEDHTIETATYDGNPSVNKDTYRFSESFEDSLNQKKHLLNKGNSSKKRKARWPRHKSLEALFSDDWDDEIDLD